MKFAFSTNAYRKHSLEEAIDRIGRIGYRGIEIMVDAPHVWPLSATGVQIDGICQAIEAAQLEVSNVNAFMMTAVQDFWHPSWIEPDADSRRLRLEHTKAALTLAQKIGSPSITTEPGGPLPTGMTFEQGLDIFVAGLMDSLRVAEELGVRLLVEPEPDLLIENADQFLALAELIDSPMFGLNFDLGHFYCVGEDLPATIARLAEYSKHYHVEDIAASRVHEHLIPGHGAIDFHAALRAIARTDFQGWITVELYPYLDHPDAAGREALDHLTSQWPS